MYVLSILLFAVAQASPPNIGLIGSNKRHCPCRYTAQTKEEQRVQSLHNCKDLCKPWEKYYPKPITQLACENACSTFYTFLANDFEERATFNPNVYDPSEEFPCTISWLSSRLPAVVPLGSIPREATRGGCRQASVIFSQCIRIHLTGGKSSGSLRGAGGSSGHASKLNQLANWRKASDLEGGGAANDPLL